MTLVIYLHYNIFKYNIRSKNSNCNKIDWIILIRNWVYFSKGD